MFFLKKPKPATIDDIRERLIAYCNGLGTSYWAQNVYKDDFFLIFYAGYYNDFCGGRANWKYDAAYKRKRSVKVDDYVIHGENLKSLLKSEWLKGKAPHQRQRAMIEDLTRWWDDWTFAWDHHPRGIPRKYIRKS